MDGAWKRIVRSKPVYSDYFKEGIAEWYSGRNYCVFSALADVRNDARGTLGHVEPIAAPRGFPEDCDPPTVWSREQRQVGLRPPVGVADGDHTPSWLTLAEVFNYDWGRIYWDEGVLSYKDFSSLKILPDGTLESPSGWSRSVGSAGVSVETNEGMSTSLRYSWRKGDDIYTVAVDAEGNEGVVDSFGYRSFLSTGKIARPVSHIESCATPAFLRAIYCCAQQQLFPILTQEELQRISTVIRWKYRLSDRCADFLEAMEALRTEARDVYGVLDLDLVRIVFNFDS